VDVSDTERVNVAVGGLEYVVCVRLASSENVPDVLGVNESVGRTVFDLVKVCDCEMSVILTTRALFCVTYRILSAVPIPICQGESN
jgi:hypothetical protein